MQLCKDFSDVATLLVSMQQRMETLEQHIMILQKQLGAPTTWLTAQQVADIKNVSASTIYRRLLHNKNIIPNVDFKEEGRRVWIASSAINKI